MDLILAFLIFMAAMAATLAAGITMILPLIAGLAAFSLVALKRGFKLPALFKMACRGASESLVVVLILVLIGCLTALWRDCGAIAYFTDYGIRLIPGRIFILAAFLLSALMSYLLGTSFGVAGTMGVILMTIARASGVSTVLSGGAILSGIYFGDRASPASSSANLVANETHTELNQNMRWLLKSSIAPMLICTALYLLLSLTSRPVEIDTSLLTRFEGEFHLSIWCLLPAALLLVLAFAGVKIRYVMMIDIAVSIVLTVLLQHRPLLTVLKTMLLGYAPADPELTAILSGGGIASMLNVMGILLLSSACAGIFEGTRMLHSIEAALTRLCARVGRFPAMLLTGLGVSAVFCNQTIGIIMCRQCMGPNYPDTPEGRTDLMREIENSVIVVSGLMPWCIACSVPLKMLGCDARSLVFAAYLYLVPICWYIWQRISARHRKRAKFVL